jgi:poly(hydroxyalkanoate) depolymerase family esterase
MFLLMLLVASSFGQALTKTTTTISSSLNPSTYGQAVTFTASVSPVPPNGETVTFKQGSNVLGTSSLSGGTATFTISILAAGGTDNIKATYAGDSTYASSTSTALPQVVNPASTTITLVSALNPANTGQAVTLTATVTSQNGGTPTGNVEFMNGGSQIQQVSLSNGVATITNSNLNAGTDSLTALYKGSTDFATSTSNTVSEVVYSGTTINTTMVDLWGVTRYYMLFVPGALPANPPLVMMLHGTHYDTPPANPSTMSWGWQTYANQYGFILVQPASTYNENSGAWNWNDYFMDASFTPTEGGSCTSPPATSCPDDAGFLRQLIVNLTSQYNLNPNQIYVTGFSSGAQMTERVGVEISDLVAAIVPSSGQMEGQQAAPPPVLGPQNALAPISVQEWHGTADTELPPCNYGTTNYSGIIYYLDTVDNTFNYWVSQNACSTLQTTQTLCTDEQPTSGLSGNIATGCSGNSTIEVQFIWEDGLGHSWVSKNDPTKWQFMAAHPKQSNTVRKSSKTTTLNLEPGNENEHGR